MEFGTALLLDRTQILQNDHIYIMQFCVLNPFQIQLNYWNCISVKLSMHCHTVLLHHMKISFQVTIQRNKLLEKGKMSWNQIWWFSYMYLAVLIFFKDRHRYQQDESTI